MEAYGWDSLQNGQQIAKSGLASQIISAIKSRASSVLHLVSCTQ